MSTKNSADTIGNRTRHLPVCGEVPQPAAPPRTPKGILSTTLLYSQPQRWIFNKISHNETTVTAFTPYRLNPKKGSKEMIKAYCCTVCASFCAIYNPDFLAESSTRNYCCSTVCVSFFNQQWRKFQETNAIQCSYGNGILYCW